MSVLSPLSLVKTTALAAALASVLAGCSYDNLSHDDRVSYRAGDAVKANLARETIDPARKSSNKVGGLGGDGHVVPPDPVTP